MDIIHSLMKLHFTDREARVYLALLEHDQATPLTIANVTGLKRPTVYIVLEELRRKEMVGITVHAHKKYYVPESPQKLLGRVRSEQRIVQDLLPILKARSKQDEQRPAIRIYENSEDIIRIWREATWQSSDVAFISNTSEWVQQYPALDQEYDALLQAGQIQRSRELMMNTETNRSYAQSRIPQRQVRILPTALHFAYDISLWEGHVAFYSLKHHYLLVIGDNDLAESLQSMYDLLWTMSENITPKRPQRSQLRKGDVRHRDQK